MTTDLTPSERIIVPLDMPQLRLNIVEDLVPLVGVFKIGYELGFSQGWDWTIDKIMTAGGKVFVDAKLSDIPNTCAAAAKVLVARKPWAINVHANAGHESIRAVVETVKEHSPDTLVLAVTVLTSIELAEAQSIYNVEDPIDIISGLAWKAAKCGVDGIICSPADLGTERFNGDPVLPADLLKVTPGVRPSWAAANDQKRFTTPAEAIRLGADYLVIGRPILKPPEKYPSRQEAAMAIADEITAANIAGEIIDAHKVPSLP